LDNFVYPLLHAEPPFLPRLLRLTLAADPSLQRLGFFDLKSSVLLAADTGNIAQIDVLIDPLARLSCLF
jgi:hypothetical protein